MSIAISIIIISQRKASLILIDLFIFIKSWCSLFMQIAFLCKAGTIISSMQQPIHVEALMDNASAFISMWITIPDCIYIYGDNIQ